MGQRFSKGEKVNRFRVVATIICLTLVALALPSPVNADASDKKTIVTFSQPVEIPGAQVLPAGTYVFKLLDSSSKRNIVQIFNEAQNHVYATILAIPNSRLQATDKTVITFGERAAGKPEAIRAWFYPGANRGQEFVYPKTRAIELAKTTHQPVLAMPAELAPNLTQPVKSVDEPPVIALKEAPVTAVKPTGDEVPIAEVIELPPMQTASAMKPEATKQLPKTASPLPLAGLVGLLSLGTGFVLSVIRKRSA
jgi:LPXTG-motif cell wall-anchored protein